MTSKLEKYLSNELYTRFGQYSIRQNYRPQWLEGLELDFYIEEISIAAEVQGDQHYKFTPRFHKDYDDFLEQRKRDEKKQHICKERNIRLFEVFTEKDADLFIHEVRDIASPPKYFYREDVKKKSNKLPLSHRDIVVVMRNIEKQKQEVLSALEIGKEKDLKRCYLSLKASARTIIKYPEYIDEKELEELNRIQKACRNFFDKKQERK